MKKNTLLIAALICANFFLLENQCYSQIAINSTGATPNSRAMLDIDQVGKGLLIPRMTQVRRDTITSIPTSLMIYQTDNPPGYYYYDGGSLTQVLT